MKALARIVGIVIAALGLLGLISPSSYVRLGWFWAQSPGLYIAAVLQLIMGLVLLRAAPSSRSPVGLGIVGAFAIGEAVLAPLLGFGKTQVVAKWWAALTPGVLRLWALVGLAIGVLIVLAVAPRRDERGGGRHVMRRADATT
ncbi:hypothetical protein AKJ09_02023 [Labilithrix luteola]|uniref:Uncharacterized protein n=1 Tax=Labilithrix luteola TaxID=1391654 RepID=A0A0K1PQG8_9BACT|nr:hypothetical protein [Labilithrix luteola]AKU95359.1 hypothetical protein AKJ09_02023 [Labilithrix luteola]